MSVSFYILLAYAGALSGLALTVLWLVRDAVRLQKMLKKEKL